MTFYTNFVLILSVSISVSGPAAFAAPAKTPSPKLSEFAKNLNAFSTFETYLSAHRDVGLLTELEHAAILDYLRLKKVNLETPVKPGKVEGDKVTFGQASLTEQTPGVWVTQDGVRLKMDDYKSADEAFRGVYAAMTERKRAGLDSFILPKAYAFDALEAAQAALVAVPYHAAKGFTNVVILGVAGTSMTAVSAIASPLIRMAGNLNKKGSITCKDNMYVVHGGFMNPDMKQVYKQYEVFRDFDRRQKTQGKDGVLDAYFPELAGLSMAGGKYMELVWNPTRPDNEQKVDDSFVKKTFGGKMVPCDEKNANKVSLTMKDEALQIAAAAIRASNKKESSPNSKPADATR